ncbi:hypothetical protein AAMO2058_000265100 [Amorphochlora amoebiformis]|uniref:Uncharacterized protein n=1 Tax=Amorphochlora amoebiformis TaxID=1561963 RepID=A0A7S0DGF6_9EUKA|mmetsp:Transcript_27305/g.43339  ORF Transcript_27305/g.43339 Transcript_27305/m.43339 type:complete len:252 (+) Transcript_27305:68-823(+)|eukprot:1358000-Amorphochlora_amoeboformis.AAC.1
MKTENAKIHINPGNSCIASELAVPDEKLEKMKKSPPNMSRHIRTILSALFLRGDYVSMKYGGANGIVVASCISFSPAIISGIFLLLFPLSYYCAWVWFGTILVASLGAIVHAGASALGVGYGFNPSLSLCSHLLGAALAGGFRVWLLLGGFTGALAILIVMATSIMSGFYVFRETVYTISLKISQSGEPVTKKTLLYPLRQLQEQIIDILNSPPLEGRHRGDQYYINEVAASSMRSPSGPKFAKVVGVVRE